jgi:hypothetical protein
MEHKLVCIKCGKELSFSNFGSVRSINGKAISCCKDCSPLTIEELKQKYFCETYNNNDIYMYEGRYYPYWECAYSFNNIEDCRARIDMKGVSVVPTELLNRVRLGKSLL